MTTITVCRTCRRDKTNDDPVRDGHRLLEALHQTVIDRNLGEEITVRSIACMSACEMACAAQISDDDKFTYALAHLDPDASVDGLIEFAQTHAEVDHGLVIKSQRPADLKDKVIARVPPANFSTFPVEENWPATEELSE